MCIRDSPKDVLWLERFHRLDEKKIDRIVTIAYLTLVKIDKIGRAHV